MRKRSIVIGAILVSGALLFWMRNEKPQPKHNGHSLEYWIEEYRIGSPEGKAAIQAMGTNALPFLLRWLCIKEPTYRDYLSDLAGKLPRRVRPRWTERGYVSRSFLSAHASKALGGKASSVIPDL